MDLPLSVVKNGSITYRYDENGNRVFKDDGQSAEWYLYDHMGRNIAVFDAANNNRKMINLFGLDNIGKIDFTYTETTFTDPESGEIITSLTAEREKSYYIKDHLGSIRQTISEGGSFLSAQDYYPYGKMIPSRVMNSGEVNSKFKFTSKERDVETGLDYFGARYYNSSIGLWHSVDPLAAKYPGWSPYNYVLNKPLMAVDPDGRSAWDIVKGFVNSLKDNNTFGLTQARQNASYENSSDGRIGEQIGNAVSLVQSAFETFDGAAKVVGGGTLAVAGSETLIAVPVGGALTLAGAAETAHGVSVGVMAINNMMGSNGQTKGTRVNPDGSAKNPIDQLDQISKKQDRYRKQGNGEAINRIEKSKQNVKNKLKEIK